jgi:hypothetical protein
VSAFRVHDRCGEHTEEVVRSLGPLIAYERDEGTFDPAELPDWVLVEEETDPDLEGHPWRVDLADEVGLLIDPDHDDVADLLSQREGILSVTQLDREVLAVSAPDLCQDSLRAAVIRAVAGANARALGQAPRDAQAHEASRPAPEEASAADDEDARLVTGNARSGGRRVQVWVDLEGILVLPVGVLPHGPLDTSDNPRYERASFTPTEAGELARSHGGEWVTYSHIVKAQLQRPVSSPGVGEQPSAPRGETSPSTGAARDHTGCSCGPTS